MYLKKLKGRRQIPPVKGSFRCHIGMKLKKKLLVAALAGAMVLSSGVSSFAIEDNTDNSIKLQEEVSVQVINEILDNVDKILDKLEKNFESEQLEKNPELKKLEKNPEVEKLKKDVKEERALLDIQTSLTTKYAIGVMRRFDEAIGKIKQLKAQHEFGTKEEAEKAAKTDLETELVKNAFDLEEKDGKWHYTLKFKEIEPEKSANSTEKQKTEEETKKSEEEAKKTENEKKIDGLKNSSEKQKEEEAKKKAEEEAKKKAEEEAKRAEEEKKAEEKKSEAMKASAKKKAEEFKKNAEKKKVTFVKKSRKVTVTSSDNKADKSAKSSTDKKKLPKAGIETEVFTLATASLAGVLGVYTSIKKRK